MTLKWRLLIATVKHNFKNVVCLKLIFNEIKNEDVTSFLKLSHFQLEFV